MILNIGSIDSSAVPIQCQYCCGALLSVDLGKAGRATIAHDTKLVLSFRRESKELNGSVADDFGRIIPSTPFPEEAVLATLFHYTHILEGRSWLWHALKMGQSIPPWWLTSQIGSSVWLVWETLCGAVYSCCICVNMQAETLQRRCGCLPAVPHFCRSQ